MRKDSGCSDIALLSISGRTSRVSSVGSVASGGSGVSSHSAMSHCSGVSHLSAISNMSRGSSPHRMSLETSFCGPKPVHTDSLDIDDAAKLILPDKLVEKTEILSSSTKQSVNKTGQNITEKHLSSQSTGHSNKERKHSKEHSKYKRKKPSLENPKTQKFVSLHSDEEEEPIASRSVNTVSTKPEPVIDNRTQIYIPLHGSANEDIKSEQNPVSPKRLKPFTNATLVNFIKKYDVDEKTGRSTRRAKSATEADYRSKEEINEEFQTFISLKDDDDYTNGEGNSRERRPLKHRRSVSTANANMETPKEKVEMETNQITVPIQVHESRHTDESLSEPPQVKHDLPKYLMTNDGTTQYIPLRGSDTDLQSKPEVRSINQNYLSVSKLDHKSRSDDRNLAVNTSPSLRRQCMPPSLELSCEYPARSAKSMTQLMNIGQSRTPSPNPSLHKNYYNNDNNSRQSYLFRRCSESAREIRSKYRPNFFV